MDNSVLERAKAAVAQCVSNVVRSRRAVSALKPLPLDRKLVEDILEDAATAPSGANIQPWRVYMGSGAVKDELADAMLAASRARIAPAPAHFPDPLPEVFRRRFNNRSRTFRASR